MRKTENACDKRQRGTMGRILPAFVALLPLLSIPTLASA